MKNIFQSIQVKTPPSNTFDLTHDFKCSMKIGYLYPILCQECIPGDRWTIGNESLIRFAPMVFPILHRLDATVHYFFVPNRLTWEGWEEFITNRVQRAHPQITIDPASNTEDALCNYLGVPLSTSNVTVSAIPFAAYQMIYNEYYRDQNLMPESGWELVDGDNTTNFDLQNMQVRAWEHDYFTSALPTPQQGAPVSIPLGEVVLKDPWPDTVTGFNPVFRGTDMSTGTGDITTNGLLGADGAILDAGSGLPNAEIVAYDPAGTLEVGSTTINDLRKAFRLQEWLEKSMRSGQRYIESILAHFGVKSSDGRLDRPEYITGTKSPVVISEVLNTTGESGGLPQGNMAGHGISVTAGQRGSYFCEEHGYIIGIMSVMPKTAYQQGLPRHFSRELNTDYAWPEFANLGEQEILNKEIYINHTAPDAVFGYIPRYSEYKFAPSRVAGQFQTTMQDFHMGRIFAAQPALNSAFIGIDPTQVKRVFAVTNNSTDDLYVQVVNHLKVNRRLPFYGTPTF